MRVLRHREPRGGGDAPLRRRGHVTADASSQGRRPNLLGRPPPTDAVRDPRQGAEATVARGVVRCRVLARGDARTRARRAFQDPQRPGNVLCYGVRRKRAPSARDPPPPDRGTPGGANITGRPDLEVSVASAATTSLLGVKHWRTFHERVGDALMTHVLVHGSVFVPSALMRSNSDPGRHGSHLQLCGAPVSAVGASRAAAMARHKRAAQAARADRTTTPTQRRRKKTEKRKRREATNAAEADEVEPKNKHKRAKKTFNPAAPGLDSRKALDPSSGDSILGTQSQESQPGRDGWIRGTRGRNGTHGNGVTFDDLTGGGDATSSRRVRRGRGTHREPVHVTRAEDGGSMSLRRTGACGSVRNGDGRRGERRRSTHARSRRRCRRIRKIWTRTWWRSPTRVSPHVRTNPRTLWETRDDRINRPG